MTVHSFEHPIPAPGQSVKKSLAELFGLSGTSGPSEQLRDDLENIRISELHADEIGASIRLY